jgi:prolipoprotein diacylglyceryltransferase
MDILNQWLDRLPRTRVGLGGREAPAFRTCGIAGYYAAVILTMGAGLVGGRSLLALAGVSAVCALSFFVWALARRAVTGHEELVLLEHVWFAEAASAAFLGAIGVPVLAHLDAVAVGLCGFLAAGRIGCTLVGCCHGRPSSTIGIVYDAESVGCLAGVRLFPVAAIEALGLAVIGLAGFVAIPYAREGDVLAWFLIAYAVLRFGLEGIRGDARPHLLGLSQARWMAIAEAAVAIALVERRRGGLDLSMRTLAPAFLLAALLVAAIARWLFGRERRLLSRRHRTEAVATWNELRSTRAEGVASLRTSAGLVLALSRAEDGRHLHASCSLPSGPPDLALLCSLAAALLPDARIGHVGPGPILHLVVPAESGPDASRDGRRLYAEAARYLQPSDEPEPARPRPALVREGYFAREG